MWGNNKKLNAEMKQAFDYIQTLQNKVEKLEKHNENIEKEKEQEKEKDNTKKCPKGCTKRIYLGFSNFGNRPIRLKLVGGFLICPKCGYTEPHRNSKYTNINDIGFSLEDLEEKVNKLLLKKKSKK
ncbi:MAG TPA: hypothetical protein VMX17_15725 [Candidatus Glassbacteria bacterium]|nr:hypothetical protein [Candidatus Glassbacteria bacterium]